MSGATRRKSVRLAFTGAGGAAILFACAVDPNAGTPSDLFGAVAMSLRDSTRSITRPLFPELRIPITVDPRPFRTRTSADATADTGALHLMGVPVFGRISERALAERRRMLQTLGIDVAPLDALKDCPGVMAVAPIEERRTCPRRPVVTAAIGIRDSTATRAVVEVFVMGTDSLSMVATHTLYELERRGGQWHLGRLGLTTVLE